MKVIKSFSLELSTLQDLELLAKERKRSVGSLVNQILLSYCFNQKPKNDKPEIPVLIEESK